MKLPDNVLATLNRFVERFPVPQGPAGETIEEQVRQWTAKATAQVCMEHPNQGYGSKRGDPGRPLTKDGLANNQIQPGRLLVWDMVTGAGTGQGKFVAAQSDSAEITGQVFVEVAAVDYLGGGGAPAPAPEPGAPAPADALSSFIQDVRASLGRVEQKQAELEQGQAEQSLLMHSVESRLSKGTPAVGEFPPYEITLKNGKFMATPKVG